MLEAWREQSHTFRRPFICLIAQYQENIDFGTPTNEIDIDRVRQACEYQRKSLILLKAVLMDTWIRPAGEKGCSS